MKNYVNADLFSYLLHFGDLTYHFHVLKGIFIQLAEVNTLFCLFKSYILNWGGGLFTSLKSRHAPNLELCYCVL